MASYTRALSNPAHLGGWAPRCGARYNLACALARAGRGADAWSLLAPLLTAGGASVADALADDDLTGLRDWLASGGQSG